MKILKILLIIQTILVSANLIIGLFDGYAMSWFFINTTLLGINYFLYRVNR